MAPNKRQAIIWTIDSLILRIYTPLGPDELVETNYTMKRPLWKRILIWLKYLPDNMIAVSIAIKVIFDI